MKTIQNVRLIGLIILSFLSFQATPAQENLNISVGLGHPELLNFGLKFQREQTQVGITVGVLPGNDDDAFSIGVDYYHHFGSSSELSARRPWFYKGGLNYYTVKNEYEKNQYFFLVPRVGRDFNLSRNLGIAIEADASFVLTRKEEELKPRGSSGFFDGSGSISSVLPSLGINLFYRL